MGLLKFLFFFMVILTAQAVKAFIYESNFEKMGRSYLKRVAQLPTEDVEALSGAPKDQCLRRYSPMIEDGLLDIRIVIGYFDWTTGSTIRYRGKNYGYSPSIDPGAYAALRKLLRARCSGRAEFCDFEQESAYRFRKTVLIQGRKVQARVEMIFASISEYLATNTGRYASEQRQRSHAAQEFFQRALRSADAVFYFGHSRDGGGPDFHPPVFVTGSNRVNYDGYYKKERPGMKKMLAALSSGRQPSILSLMSCDSKDHFLSRIRQVAPQMGVILSKDVLKVDGVFTALVGGVDAVLRGQCQKGFIQSLRRTSFNERYIMMDGMFE